MIAFLLDDWVRGRFTLPDPDVPTLSGRDPEAAAVELRVRWGLGEQPIRNMVHLLEAHGVRVYSLPRQNSDLDAFCLYRHGQPFVFLGTDKSGERARFDAAHALAHLVLHAEEREPHGPEAEHEAQRFAAAFLMPRASVLAQGLRNASVDRVLIAKSKWDVAAMAMVHRANEPRSAHRVALPHALRESLPNGVSQRRARRNPTRVLATVDQSFPAVAGQWRANGGHRA